MANLYSSIIENGGRLRRYLMASFQSKHFQNKTLIVAIALVSIFLIRVLRLYLWNKVGAWLVLWCLVGTALVFVCKKKIWGGGYVFLTLLLCNLPAFWIAKRSPFTHEQCAMQGAFFFGLILLCFFVVFLLGYLKHNIHNWLVVFSFNIVSALILLIPFVCSACYLINWSLGRPVLREDAVLAGLQTDYQEAVSYFLDNLRPKKLLWSLISVAAVFVMAFMTTISSFICQKLCKYAVALGLCLAITVCIMCYSNIVTAPFIYAHNNLRQYALFHGLRSNIVKTIPKTSKSFKGTFVIVIGESLTKMQMGVYGYDRGTTPWQSKIAHDNKTIVFQNAFSNHTHTVPTLSLALTQKNQYNASKIAWEKAVSLIDIAKYAAGFYTVWVSNQVKLGNSDTPIASIASSADWQYFVNKSYRRPEYDEILFYAIQNLSLKNDKNLIFVHLMGNHGSYRSRYPKSFEAFKETGSNLLVNQYDNSVYYNDYVLKQIYELATKLPNFQAMLYFSDHGEDPLRGLGHDSARFTWDMAKIPMWMVFSDDYVKSHPDFISNLRAHKDTPFTNDLIFDTVLGLLGLTDNEYYTSANDLCSNEYHHSYADLTTLHGRKPLSTLPNEYSLRKIWLHRVNCPEKLLELGEHYHGLEFDVYYHESLNDFENSHDALPRPTPNTPIAFPLENQLKTLTSLDNWKDKRLGIDFKNLTHDNKFNAEKRLAELFAKYGIAKANCYVESTNWRELDIFRRQNWNTSYYFPYYKFPKLSEKEKEEIRNKTVEIAKSGNVNAVSFAGKYYDFVTSLDLPDEIDLLTWFDGVARRDFECSDRYFPIINNPRIKAILVKEYGHHHR